MRKTVSFLFAAAVTAAVAAVCSTGAWAQTAPQGNLDAKCQVETTQLLGFNPDQRAAQTFTAVASGKLTSAQVLVLKDISDGTADYTIKVAPVNASGVPTSEVLASATVPNSSVPNGRQTITANFDPASAATVEAGRKYALVVQRGNNDAFLDVPYRTDNPCAGGSVYWSTAGAPFWQSDGNRDLVFATYVTPSDTTPSDTTPPPAPEISSPADNSYDADGEVSLSGTAEALSTVEIFEGATLRGTATADAQGAWSEALAGVPEGRHTYTATATDAANNTSAHSAPRTVTVDTTKPKVVTAGPATRETSPRANVTAVFSEPMERGTIDGATFTLVRKGTSGAVPAEVTYSAAANEATLDPARGLKRGAVYRAIVTAGAEDLAGNPLFATKAWSFKVRG